MTSALPGDRKPRDVGGALQQLSVTDFRITATNTGIIMAALYFAMWFLLSFYFFLSFFLAYSQPSQIGCLPYFHT